MKKVKKEKNDKQKIALKIYKALVKLESDIISLEKKRESRKFEKKVSKITKVYNFPEQDRLF